MDINDYFYKVNVKDRANRFIFENKQNNYDLQVFNFIRRSR